MALPRRRFGCGRFAALAALAATLASARARAQADLNPPLPNVLLLVDTSGSMEYQIDGSPVTCNPGNTAGVNDKSRWTDLVEVLTGSIDGYSCQQLDRTDSGVGFRTGEYALGGDPYDFRYPIPYHRPLSNGCAAGPGTQSTNPFIYPTVGGINYHDYGGTGACTFSQPTNDGVLDAFQDYVRFGLMTFDTSTDPGTGFSGLMGDSATANSATGKAGLWSYVVGASAKGMPSGCTTGTKDEEVGARNAAAPPWEGRMVNFGNPYDGVGDYLSRNKHIQEILLATRPYGATPIAGMLHDAADFFANDHSTDPDRNPSTLAAGDVAADFGPYRDPFVGCTVPRREMIILLTDGQPNMDLRPFCASSTETPAGVCPFETPEKIVAELDTATATHPQIPTYVVGFALDKVDDDNDPATAPKDCSTLTAADVDQTSSSNLCNKPANAGNQALQACCTLQRIAIAGGKGTVTDSSGNSVSSTVTSAYFASDREALRSQLSAILSSALQATARTQAVQAGSGNNSAGSSGGSVVNTFRFFTGFQPWTLKPWTGTLQRQRFTCDKDPSTGLITPHEADSSQALGDDFGHNMAKAGPDARHIFTVLGGNSGADPITSLETIRPYIGTSDPDGVGIYGGRSLAGTSASFISGMPLEALAIPASSCVDQDGKTLATNAQCRDLYLKWWLGYNNGQSTVTPRCAAAGNDATCQLLGDIVHSTPVVIDRPTAGLRDESYARFELLQATRPMVLYVSSNDGLLHAFRVNTYDKTELMDDAKSVRNDGQTNELWAFAPPAVLPSLYNLYPYNHQVLLDGAPTFQDVVAVQPTQSGQIPTVFERSATDARIGAAAWRTVLAQSFGSQHSGYFALDVTTPVLDPTAPDDPTKGGPRMLWQLTRDKNGKNLFGRGGTTPLITTLFFDLSGTNSPKEVPVAVLPGGSGGTPVTTGPGCPAGGRDYSSATVDQNFPPRPRVHCYSFANDEAGARSLTIVRLDTGEIVRTFRLNVTDVSSELQARTTQADLDAPITGQPVAFPGGIGVVADRIFVGDADGRLFKVDVSSSDPSKWTMKIFADLFPATLQAKTGAGFNEGQPIQLPPSVSVDASGNVVLDVASGDQNLLGPAPTVYNRVFSLSEVVSANKASTTTKVNWYSNYDGGERVMGPMVLFNNSIYFATYRPPLSTDACSSGQSTIRGGHYLNVLGSQAGSPSTDLGAGPDQPLTPVSFNAVTSGVAAVQDPDCSVVADDSVGDPVLGYGHQLNFSSISTGQFKLVFETGNLKQSGSAKGVSVGTQEIVLPPPPTLSTIESWASITE
jgi:type IV pilus assembly protein PilY1